MKRIMFLLAIMLVVFVASAQKINVAASANLRYVLEEIKTAYMKKYPSVKIDLTFGASGTLYQQISNGARFDFFMAADTEFPTKLRERGFAAGEVNTYAYGKLVLYSSSLPVDKRGLDILKHATIAKIAVANPATAPYGDRAVKLLKALTIYDEIKHKIVIAENISATAQYVSTGNTELGFIALSLALAPDMKGKGSYYVIPGNLYQPIAQSCVLIKKAELNTAAAEFQKYVLSAETKKMWVKWGYDTPKY